MCSLIAHQVHFEREKGTSAIYHKRLAICDPWLYMTHLGDKPVFFGSGLITQGLCSSLWVTSSCFLFSLRAHSIHSALNAAYHKEDSINHPTLVHRCQGGLQNGHGRQTMIHSVV
ncbi:hypothetical protein FRC02_004268 [Tulasnella sp. 418]|nr:hypothetical protein FRC02_004268 [Tulasnella sp. 418]